MIEIPFLLTEIIFACVWIAVRVIVCVCKKEFDIKREALLLLMYVNLAVIIRFTFFPFSKIDGHVQPLILDTSAIFPFKINAVPFIHIAEFDTKRELLINIIGNTTMFIPSGIILPILYKKLDSFRKVTAAGALMSLCIEIIQLPFAVRTSDVDDLILNTLGCVIGFGIYALVLVIIQKTKQANQQ